MVGVPGRSKACSTCRRRKKGCDLQRPVCSQCRRVGLACGGYERTRIFIHTTQLPPPSSTALREASRDGSDASPRVRTAGGLAVYRDPPVGSFRRSGPSIGAGARPRPSPAPAASDLRIIPVRPSAHPGSDWMLVRSACEENMLAAFWRLYLPNSTVFPSQATHYASGDWTNVVRSLYLRDGVLRHALMANCLSALAQQQGASPSLTGESLRAHGRALQALRLALGQPCKARSDSVFSALRLMIVFSMFFSDTYEKDRMARATGWREHTLGVQALLEARGPEAHVRGHGHQMFVDCRLSLIVRAIRKRKHSLMNTLPWMTIPWAEIPKTPKDRLIDIIAGIPSILEGIDCLGVLPVPGKNHDVLRRQLVASCWNKDHQLCSWYQTSVPLERLRALEQSPPDGRLSTHEMSLAYCMCVFSTACLLLYDAMRQLAIPDLPARSSMAMYIGKIGTYLAFFFHPSAGQYDLEMTSFPLGVCLQMLYKYENDAMASEKAMFNALIESERGREIMDFLRSMMYAEAHYA